MKFRTGLLALVVFFFAMSAAAPCCRAENSALGRLHELASSLGLAISEIVIPNPIARLRALFFVPVVDYHAVPEKNSIQVTAFAGPVAVTTTFNSYALAARIDLVAPVNSRIQATVQTASLVVLKPFWVPRQAVLDKLQTAVYPQATMTSTAIRATSRPNVYDADVDLVLIGQTYHKTLTVALVSAGGKDLRMNGTLSFSLNDGHRVVETYDVLLRPN